MHRSIGVWLLSKIAIAELIDGELPAMLLIYRERAPIPT
jgi:hypothetical protein